MWAEMWKSSIRPPLHWEEEGQERVVHVSGRTVLGGEGKQCVVLDRARLDAADLSHTTSIVTGANKVLIYILDH